MPENKNPPENEEEKISRVGVEAIECKHPDCKETALSLSSYCWIHTEDKEEYREKIQEWARQQRSMWRFNLRCVQLVWGYNLSASNLRNADLSEALLWECDLSRTILWDAKLPGAELTGANLSEAELWGANLYNTLLKGANLSGAKGLTRENFSQKLTKKEKEQAEEYKGSYMTVKNFFIQSGQYDDASWAAFRERTLERIAWYKQTKLKGTKDLFRWNRWKAAFKWFGSKIISMLNGYGERPLRAVISSLAIVMGFSLFYFFSKCIEANPPNGIHWWDYLYFSIVTFTTLGYGDIRPMAAPGARMVASGEAFIGAFMIALFVLTLARRYVAR